MSATETSSVINETARGIVKIRPLNSAELLYQLYIIMRDDKQKIMSAMNTIVFYSSYNAIYTKSTFS